MLAENKIHLGDCLKLLANADEHSVDLVFADPPFNIGYHYDEYDDRVEYDEYVKWSRSWIAACQRVLKPDGSLYIAIGAEFAAEIRMIGRDLGLHLRNWIVWHYSFGQNMKNKFARAHTHIFYFVVDPKQFTFKDTHVRVPSARHTEYSDKRANPMGKMPDDVWNEFPRVCGTFKERRGWHGCQMPEALLNRIIRASSDAGDLVLDPFAGSGTTLVSAAKLNRRFIGTELSRNYAAQARSRLSEAQKIEAGGDVRWNELQVDTLCSLYRETNTARANLTPNRVAMECFTRLLNERLAGDYQVDEVLEKLASLDRGCTLPRLRNDRPYTPRVHRNGTSTDTSDDGQQSFESILRLGS